jgi:transcriptional regulator with XRE-family HTH domain
MSDTTPHPNTHLASKIAALVAEKGWNQEDFARIAGINRHTVRQLVQGGDDRRLRNATVAACARALGLSVNDLRHAPLSALLPRMHQPAAPAALSGDERLRRLFEKATQPELRSWLERHPERSRQLSDDEIEELLAIQNTGRPLSAYAIEEIVTQMERRRNLIDQVLVIAGTRYLELLEQMVGLIYEKVQPPAGRP